MNPPDILVPKRHETMTLPADTASVPIGALPAGRLGGRDLALCFLIAALADIVVGGRLLSGVLAGGLVNPDSYMRLVRLDDILTNGAVLDSVFRDGGGQGTQLHWSHLLDSLIVLLAQPLRLFLPWPQALQAVAAAFGPLSVGALAAATAWAAAPLAARGFLWLVPLAIALPPAIAGYGIPGVLHHHVALMVVVVMLGGWTLRASRTAPVGAGLALGAWSALGLWFTPEATPFILIAFALLWLSWLVAADPAPAARMVREAGFGLLFTVLLILAADPPRPDRWAALTDRISVVHLAMAGATALAASLTWAIDATATATARRLVLGCLAGALCIGLWIAAFPGLLRGAEGLLDAPTAALFFRGIAEMQPVRGLADSLTYLSPGVIAVAILAWMALRAPSLTALAATLAATLAALALVGFSLQHVRFASYPACLAAALLPVALTRLTAALSGRHGSSWAESRLALARVGTIAAVVLLPQLGGALATRTEVIPTGAPGAACPVTAAVAMLAPYAGRVVLSDVNDVPELLYRTSVRTVGSLYHRSPGNFLRLRAAWRSRPDHDGAALLRASGAELVLYCPQPRASSIVADLPGDTLLDALAASRPPPWLREIARDPAGHVLYELLP